MVKTYKIVDLLPHDIFVIYSFIAVWKTSLNYHNIEHNINMNNKNVRSSYSHTIIRRLTQILLDTFVIINNPEMDSNKKKNFLLYCQNVFQICRRFSSLLILKLVITYCSFHCNIGSSIFKML